MGAFDVLGYLEQHGSVLTCLVLCLILLGWVVIRYVKHERNYHLERLQQIGLILGAIKDPDNSDKILRRVDIIKAVNDASSSVKDVNAKLDETIQLMKECHEDDPEIREAIKQMRDSLDTMTKRLDGFANEVIATLRAVRTFTNGSDK